MNVELGEKFRHRLEQLSASLGRPLREILDEVMEKGLDRVADSRKISIEEAKGIVERIRALPEEGPDDGFSGRDHDQLLYPPAA